MDPIKSILELVRWLESLPPVPLRLPHSALAGSVAGALSAMTGFLFYRVQLPGLANKEAFSTLKAWVASMGDGLATTQFVWALGLGAAGGLLLGSVHSLSRVFRLGRLWSLCVSLGAILSAFFYVPFVQIVTGGTGPFSPVPPYALNYAVFGAVCMLGILWAVDFNYLQPFRGSIAGSFLPCIAGYFAFMAVGCVTGWGGFVAAALAAVTACASLILFFVTLYLVARAIQPRRRFGF